MNSVTPWELLEIEQSPDGKLWPCLGRLVDGKPHRVWLCGCYSEADAYEAADDWLTTQEQQNE
jgi:hypothetical protein